MPEAFRRTGSQELDGKLSAKETIMFNVKVATLTVASLLVAASAAVAAPTITDHSYWPSASFSRPATPAVDASAQVAQSVRSEFTDPVYQGGPHPR